MSRKSVAPSTNGEAEDGDQEGTARLRSRTLRADPDRETLEELKEIFGPGRVHLARIGSGS